MYVEKDEWYPVYSIEIGLFKSDNKHEIPLEVIAEWDKVYSDFEAIQKKLGEIYAREKAKRRASNNRDA